MDSFWEGGRAQEPKLIPKTGTTAAPSGCGFLPLVVCLRSGRRIRLLPTGADSFDAEYGGNCPSVHAQRGRGCHGSKGRRVVRAQPSAHMGGGAQDLS